MPYQPIIPIWGGLNTANSPSSTGLVDPVTNQQYNTGGLNAGDYFDLTEKEANTLSNTTVGTCHAGRYRYVQLDSGATVANVKTGTVGYLRAGGAVGRVTSVAITTAGTGATTGSFTIAATVGSGGGAGATIQVVVAGGAITQATVLNSGAGYTSVPTFSLTATGTSGGVVAAQLDSSSNVVTSYDQAGVTGSGTVRPVVFLNAVNTWTPGNYAFIQELGVATVLGNSSIGTAAIQNFISATTGGTVSSGTTFTVATLGQALDLPLASNLFKILMTGPVVQD